MVSLTVSNSCLPAYLFSRFPISMSYYLVSHVAAHLFYRHVYRSIYVSVLVFVLTFLSLSLSPILSCHLHVTVNVARDICWKAKVSFDDPASHCLSVSKCMCVCLLCVCPVCVSSVYVREWALARNICEQIVYVPPSLPPQKPKTRVPHYICWLSPTPFLPPLSRAIVAFRYYWNAVLIGFDVWRK